MPVVVTGFGAVSAAGSGRAALWEALAAGLDGIRPIHRFAIDGIPQLLGGLVPEHAAPLEGPHAHKGLSITMAVAAGREALAHAAIGAEVARERIALVVGTSIGDDLHDPTPLDVVTQRIGDALAIAGPRITVSTACTSSTNAIGLAKDLLDAGVADIVLAGGTDVLTPEIYAGFHAIGVLSPQKCAAFSTPFGTTLGEGAGFVVLERCQHAAARAASPLATIAGYGLSADAFHETSPDPGGTGIARAIHGALACAGIAPTDVDYVNAHGTGTQANDPAEWRALVRVFGPHSDVLPVSSSKPMLGHAQGAAGVLELLVTLIGMRESVIPPTLGFTTPRAHGPKDPVGQPRPRPGKIRHALCTNSAFGGANAAVVLAAATPAPPVAVARQRRDVFIRGTATVGGDVDLEQVAPTISPRGIDPSTRFLIAAASLALADAGCTLAKDQRDRAGLFVGTSAVSPATADEFRKSIDQRGFAHLSASAFARMVLNAPAGACGKLLGIKGPTTTLTTGDGGGLVAIAYAAHWLATRDDADLIVAGGFDEIDRTEPMDGLSEGAACVVLGAQGSVRIAGWALAGAGRQDDVADRALVSAGIAPRTIDCSSWDTGTRRAPASGDVEAFVAAVGALRRGEIRTALVGSSRGAAISAAIVLTSGDS